MFRFEIYSDKSLFLGLLVEKYMGEFSQIFLITSSDLKTISGLTSKDKKLAITQNIAKIYWKDI